MCFFLCTKYLEIQCQLMKAEFEQSWKSDKIKLRIKTDLNWKQLKNLYHVIKGGNFETN